MDEIGYNYNENWEAVGEECGFGTAKTLDEIIIEVFDSMPNL